MPRIGRPYPISTPLGFLMDRAGISVKDLSAATGIYNRTITEYLAGRQHMTFEHRRKLADHFDIDPEVLRETHESR